MEFIKIIQNDYFRLFVKREGKVVLGKHCSNLWLLCGVLFATFLAIAFSNASLNYLDYKMNDPFINWVDIENNFGDEDFAGFEYCLNQDEAKAQYHFRGYQTDKFRYPLFVTSSSDSRNLKCRYYADVKTQLVQAILDEDNVVDGCRIANEKLDNSSFGVIITHDALMNKLGYKKDIPPFVTVGREPITYAGINSIGLRRRGYTNEQINNVQDIYRLLYNSGLNISEASEKIESEFPATAERDEILLFVRNSARGIIK